MKFRMWFKSAITGLFVSPKHAQENPETTYKQMHKEAQARRAMTPEEIQRAIHLQQLARGDFANLLNSGYDLTQNNPKPWDGKIWYPLGKK